MLSFSVHLQFLYLSKTELLFIFLIYRKLYNLLKFIKINDCSDKISIFIFKIEIYTRNILLPNVLKMTNILNRVKIEYKLVMEIL